MVLPPRPPARTNIFAAMRPVLLVVAAVLLALLLMSSAIWFATRQTADPAGAPWRVELSNRSGAAIDRATFVAVPSGRDEDPVAEVQLQRLPNARGGLVTFVLHRACDLRVVLEIDGKEHVFERVVPIGPGRPSRAWLEVTRGPRLNGFDPNTVREP